MLRAVERAAGACFVELRAQILDFAFACAFAFGIVIAAVLTLAFVRFAALVAFIYVPVHHT